MREDGTRVIEQAGAGKAHEDLVPPGTRQWNPAARAVLKKSGDLKDFFYDAGLHEQYAGSINGVYRNRHNCVGNTCHLFHIRA
jgi:hypothetical protein